MKKSLIVGLVSVLAIGTTVTPLSNVASANEKRSAPTEITGSVVAEKNEEPADLISTIEPYVFKDDQGFLQIQEDIPQDLYVEYEVDVLEEAFEKINEQVADGQLVVNDDLSITDNSISTFSSGYLSKTTHWWGERATYSNAQTKTQVKLLRDAQQDYSLIAAATAWLPAVGATSALTGAYLGSLAKSMDNSNKGNGVVVDITWALVFSTSPR